MHMSNQMWGSLTLAPKYWCSIAYYYSVLYNKSYHQTMSIWITKHSYIQNLLIHIFVVYVIQHNILWEHCMYCKTNHKKQNKSASIVCMYVCLFNTNTYSIEIYILYNRFTTQCYFGGRWFTMAYNGLGVAYSWTKSWILHCVLH